MTHAYAHAHFSNKRVIRELRIVSCPGGGVWVAVTREFERDNCVTSEILQSDWTIPNRAGVPRKSTKVPRPSFVQESREGLGPRLANRYVYRDKARHPRARSARGGVVYLAYVPYLGMIYVICVTEECNYVLGSSVRGPVQLSAAFCALPRLHDCRKLWLDAFR